MVKAQAGALLTCDIPTKEYLKWLNTQYSNNQQTGDKFIILDIDDTHMMIREDMVEFVKQKVKEFNDSNVYTAPTDQQQQ